jgi:hypothetical protein
MVQEIHAPDAERRQEGKGARKVQVKDDKVKVNEPSE